jgi:hypothetical protein
VDIVKRTSRGAQPVPLSRDEVIDAGVVVVERQLARIPGLERQVILAGNAQRTYRL